MMIENCSKHYMFIAIAGFGILTIIVLIIESNWADFDRLQNKGVLRNSSCESNLYEIVENCKPCTAYEKASQSTQVCIKNKFKEVIKCKSNGALLTQSCLPKNNDLYDFWRFETFMLIIALLSTVSVQFKKRLIHRHIVQKTQKQLLINSV